MIVSSGHLRSQEAEPQRLCADCLKVEAAERIGWDASLPSSICPRSELARTPGGLYLVAPTCDPGQIAVLDAGGGLVRRFGQHGQGPGEFQGIRGIWTGLAGRVFVLDSTRLVAEYNSDLVRIDTFRVPGLPHHIVSFSDPSVVVVQATVLAGEGARAPLHRLNADRRHDGSFGALGERAHRQPFQSLIGGRRVVAVIDPDTVLVAHPDTYAVESWSARTGELTGRIERKPEWFRVSADHTPGSTQISVLLPLGGNLLAVGISVASGTYDWDAYYDQIARGGNPLASSTPTERFDTIVEVLDLRTGQVRARTRHDSVLVSCGGDCLYSSEERPDLERYFQTWRLRLDFE